MSTRDRVELVLLGAIWGSSFLFMRVAAPEFGPLALIAVRVAVAAVFLTAVLAWRGQAAGLRGNMRELTLIGTINSAVPFSLFAFATLSLSAGFSSVLNATAPLFAAAVGLLWLRERLSLRQNLGLALGFAGVVVLVSSKLSLAGDRLAVLAGLAAAVCYGIAAHYTKRRLARLKPLAIAAGSQIGASLVLLPFAVLTWPEAAPSTRSIVYAIVLGVVCTGLAYVLYFRLLERIGTARSMTVTYLVPLFGMLWGFLFLGEPVTLRMLLGGGVVLAGVTLVARGASRRPAHSHAPAPNTPPCPSSPTGTVQ